MEDKVNLALRKLYPEEPIENVSERAEKRIAQLEKKNKELKEMLDQRADNAKFVIDEYEKKLSQAVQAERERIIKEIEKLKAPRTDMMENVQNRAYNKVLEILKGKEKL